jgi:hypothetical protein
MLLLSTILGDTGLVVIETFDRTAPTAPLRTGLTTRVSIGTRPSLVPGVRLPPASVSVALNSED